MRSKAAAAIVVALTVLEAALAIGSWVLSGLCPDLGVRNLLGGEGIRWFFGHFSENLSTPLLVWMLLLAVAVGSAADSGLVRSIVAARRLLLRERVALSFAAVALCVYIAIIAALTFSPHAVLLSASGRLLPSAFSVSLIPILAFGVTMCAVVFGVVSGRYLSIAEVFRSLYLGIERAAPLFVIYILACQFYSTALFVFGA